MQEQKIFFMGTDEAYLSLDGRSTWDIDVPTLLMVSTSYCSGVRASESMIPFDAVNAEELKDRLETAELIFLHGEYEAHLEQISAVDGCLDVIKRKRVFIMDTPEDEANVVNQLASKFEFVVKFIPSTISAFHETVNNALLERVASPQKAREAAVDEAAAEAERLEIRNGKKEEADVSDVPVPPPRPVPVKVVPEKVVPEINVAFFGEPGVGQANVIRNLNINEGVAVIKGEEFHLDGKLPTGNRDAVCLMWDASRPTTLTTLLAFIGRHESFKNAPLIFVAWNAENAPAALSGFEDFADKDLAQQKEEIQVFVKKHGIKHHAIMDVGPYYKIPEAVALKTKIVEFAGHAKKSFAEEIKIKFGMFHTRKVRTDHLKEIFEKEDLEPEDVQWLLLHKASVKPKGQTARLIEDRLGNKAENFIPPREVSSAVPELLRFLDEHERLIYPRVVMFFRSQSFATDYITENYDEKRKAILNVAERIYKANFELTYDNREKIFGVCDQEAKIPKEVIDMVEKRHPSLKRPVVVNNVTFS